MRSNIDSIFEKMKKILRIDTIFAILFSIALLVSPGYSQTTETNIDRPGMNLRSFDLTSPNPKLCQNACQQNTACKAWTYVKPGVQSQSARCWLKSGVPAPLQNTCCISGVMSSQIKQVTPIMVKQPVAADRIYFSKAPQKVQLSLFPALQKIPRSQVVPLAPQGRLVAINKIRQQINLPALQQAPSAKVFLAPYATKSGKSSYVIDHGSNCPDPLALSGVDFIPSGNILNPNGWLIFILQTIPGKTYMVDLSLNSNNKPIVFSGIFNGSITPPENYHVIIGFTANASQSELSLNALPEVEFFTFFSCELTQVN